MRFLVLPTGKNRSPPTNGSGGLHILSWRRVSQKAHLYRRTAIKKRTFPALHPQGRKVRVTTLFHPRIRTRRPHRLPSQTEPITAFPPAWATPLFAHTAPSPCSHTPTPPAFTLPGSLWTQPLCYSALQSISHRLSPSGKPDVPVGLFVSHSPQDCLRRIARPSGACAPYILRTVFPLRENPVFRSAYSSLTVHRTVFDESLDLQELALPTFCLTL